MHTHSLRIIVPGVVAIVVAVVVLLGIWFPKLRGVHKGSKIPLGTFSSVCVALLPGSWGTLLLWLCFHPASHISVLWFATPFVLCIIGSIYGHYLDLSNRQK